jgi:hypothetical protein
MNPSIKESKQRNSNLELMRIVLMIMIIAHHYVVNSGLTKLFDFNQITVNMVFLQFFGMAGKMGINTFLLITGYFMVDSEFKLSKWFRIWFEVMFYNLVISFCLFFGGYRFSLKNIIESVLPMTYGVQSYFTGTFLYLFLLIPFLNILIKNLSKNQYRTLLCLLLFLYTIISTFAFHNTFSELGWYCTVYFIAAYLRYYPVKKLENFWGMIFFLSMAITMASILVVDYIGSRFGFYGYYHMINNAQKLFAVTGAVSMFMWFKNLKLKQNNFINTVASATFGVLCIHANSDQMRLFLWHDVFKNTSFYTSSLLIIHAVCSVMIVYSVCVIIELLRTRLIEYPFMQFLEKKGFWDKVRKFQTIIYSSKNAE